MSTRPPRPYSFAGISKHRDSLARVQHADGGVYSQDLARTPSAVAEGLGGAQAIFGGVGSLEAIKGRAGWTTSTAILCVLGCTTFV